MSHQCRILSSSIRICTMTRLPRHLPMSPAGPYLAVSMIGMYTSTMLMLKVVRFA